jgi:hypothetical protein
MADTLITESGNTLVMETVTGITGASTLNDISIVTIFKETFDTTPTDRGWLIGTDWEWDAVNLRLKII